MKKKYVGLMFAASLAAAVIIGCSKEQPETESQTNTPQMTAADQVVVNRLISFRKKVEYKKAHPGYKSNEVVAIDSARWDVETNFNAAYAFPDEQYIETHSDSAVLFLPVIDDSTTLMDDVLAFNDQCFSHVLALYNSSPLTCKELLFVSLQKSEMAKGELEVKLKVVTGDKTSNNPPTPSQWVPFNEGDNWIYGGLLGKCDGSYLWESDAAAQIQNMLMQYKPVPIPAPSGYRYIYELDVENPFSFAAYEYTNSNNEYLVLFMESSTSFTSDDECLDYNEMNFHYLGEKECIYNRMRIDNGKPSNWTMMECAIEGKEEWIGTISKFQMRHDNTILYAYRYLVPEKDLDQPVSLSQY